MNQTNPTRDEPQRLRSLDASGLMYALSDPQYEAAVRLAAELCDVPMAAISLVHEHEQRLLARVGLDLERGPRKDSICAIALREGGPLLEIPDTLLDPRLENVGAVHQPPHVRFYAGVPLRLADGAPVGSLCVMDTRPRQLGEPQRAHLRRLGTLVEALMESFQQRRASERDALFYQMAVDASELGLWRYNVQSAEARVSPVFERIFGMAPGSFAGNVAAALAYVHPDDLNLIRDQFRRELESGDFRRTEFRIVHPRKGVRWLVSRSRPIRNAKGAITHITGLVFDRTEQHAQEEELLHYQQELARRNEALENLSRVDALTGAGNRRAFDEHLEAQQALLQRHQTPYALLLLDVDHFKPFNDEFGHPAGDQVLRQVASLLQSQLRVEDFLARYGGEEFAVLLPDATPKGALELAERLRLAVQSGSWEQRGITVSIGLAFVYTITDASVVIDQADQALYAAKEGGRNRVVAY